MDTDELANRVARIQAAAERAKEARQLVEDARDNYYAAKHTEVLVHQIYTDLRTKLLDELEI